MQQKPKLVKVKSLNSQKVLNFITKTSQSLRSIRKKLGDLQIKLSQFQYMMADGSPISKQSEDHIELSMILDPKNCFYVKQANGISGGVEKCEANVDIIQQKQITQMTEDYLKFQQKIKQLKERIQKFKVHFEEKIHELPKVNANYQGETNALGQYEGIGRYTYNNGEMHIGQFLGGQRHGIGCYQFANGNRYEGQYQYNVACGLGTEQLNDGDTMASHYKNNNSNGMGIFYFGSGDKLIGNFVQNNFEGKGLRIYADGTWKVQYYKDGYQVQSE